MMYTSEEEVDLFSTTKKEGCLDKGAGDGGGVGGGGEDDGFEKKHPRMHAHSYKRTSTLPYIEQSYSTSEKQRKEEEEEATEVYFFSSSFFISCLPLSLCLRLVSKLDGFLFRCPDS